MGCPLSSQREGKRGDQKGACESHPRMREQEHRNLQLKNDRGEYRKEASAQSFDLLQHWGELRDERLPKGPRFASELLDGPVPETDPLLTLGQSEIEARAKTSRAAWRGKSRSNIERTELS